MESNSFCTAYVHNHGQKDRETEKQEEVDKEEGNLLLKKDEMKREKGSERQWTGE